MLRLVAEPTPDVVLDALQRWMEAAPLVWLAPSTPLLAAFSGNPSPSW